MTPKRGAESNTKLVPISPDGGWGWVVVVGSFLIHVVADGFVYSFGVLVHHLIEEFKSDNTMSSFIISILTGLTLGSGPLASAICNKYGCRITAIIGACISIAGCAASVFATAMWHIIVSVGVVMGIGFGLMYCPAIVAVTMYFERRRSLATGIAVAGAGFGTMIFSPINGFVISHFGWRAVFVTFLGVFIFCIGSGLTFRPLPFREVDEDGGAGRAHDVGEPGSATVEKDVRPKSVRKAASLTDISSERETSSSFKQTNVGEKETGYLNRKDIFYTGSITNVSEFIEGPDRYRSTGSLRKESLSTAREISENGCEDTESDDVEGKNIFRTVSNMLSLSLLKDPTFLIFAVSNLLASLGYNAPLLFLPLHAIKGVGLDSASSSVVLSVYGFSNTVGRVVFGIIADRPLPLPYKLGRDIARNRLWIYNISLALCGIFTTFCYLCAGFTSLSVYAGLFGFFLASYVCLTSVVLVDLLGLDKLTNAFGLLLLWQGVGTVVGPPISGYLADSTDSYIWSFIFCGINLLISGLILFAVPYFQKKKESARN
ncbi:hypothetical protein RB195_012769 [Necator americanus]|uniref:Major facilitator superfamily (MFS) profile domain-containing protein n=1 Tax=Necator americanus TaxID=51031 RepID=A0ABR1DTY3_NECAM